MAASADSPHRPSVTKTAELPDIGLAEFQNVLLPGSISDDRGVRLGGVGSGLFHIQGNQYWMITDRGPNADKGDDKTFIVPEFDPTLVRVSIVGGSIRVEESIPITTASGAPVTGLPNLSTTGDPKEAKGWNAAGTALVTNNLNGLDTEGVVRTADGHFWVVEEYGPSILDISPTGQVLKRYVPSGLEARYPGADYPVVGGLPAEFANRKSNRGFEDIALLPDGHTVVVALQSPLIGATEKDLTYLLKFDTTTGTTVTKYEYKFDAFTTFPTATKIGDLKISAVIPISDTQVMVQERTDFECRFFLVTLTEGPSRVSDGKQLVVNLYGVDGVPNKIEGAALMNSQTLVLSSDNDFGFVNKLYADGTDIEDSGVRSTIVEVKLPK